MIALGLSQTIPVLPVRDAAASVACYRGRLGFEVIAGFRWRAT